ncbi:MAG: hypothetical protein J1E01_01345 [Acetatifactor sp.]|nr:hypothetical protein [Acetatifactor sp.]
MSEVIDYEPGSVADAFTYNVDRRIKNENFDSIELNVAIDILKDELFKALRTLENSIK